MKNKQNIFNFLVILILCFFNLGCSKYYWVNNRSNANWNLESAQCAAYARGNAPNPSMQSYDYGSYFSGGGVIGSTPYMYSGTIAPNYAYNMQAGLNNATNSLLALGARQNLYEQCLRNLGWRQVEQVNTKNVISKKDKNNINYMHEAISHLQNKNFVEAGKILTNEANKGNSYAEVLLGKLYFNGNGVEKNVNKAIKLYEKSAAQGHFLGEYELSLLYLDGIQVKKDTIKGKALLESSANKGYGNAQAMLGLYYIKYEKNIDKGKEWLEEAVNKGNTLGEASLGDCYMIGIGVNKDYIRAKELYEKAAAKGDSSTFNRLGYLYLNGLGVKKDYNKSLEYFDKAINNGFVAALDSKGELYEKGFKDIKKALEFYEAACQKGVKEGCNNYQRLSK